MRNKGKKILIIPSISLLIVILVCVVIYFSVYRPNFSVKKFNLYESKYLDIYENSKYIYMKPKQISEYSTGIIFYPSIFVDGRAYLPLLTELSKYGYGVYILKFPGRILGINAPENIISEDIFKDYILMGHSSGGTSLLKYFSKQTNGSKKVSGIVLLASYSNGKYIFDPEKSEDYNRSVPVLSIIGSNDGVIDIDKYENDKVNLPQNTRYVIIDGGNHSYFGNYGKHRNDNNASISLEEQQYNTIKEIEEFLGESSIN